MSDINAYCGACGNRFTPDQAWPRHCAVCGSTIYRNPLPVAVVLLPVTSGVVVIRRNTEPMRGTLTLPGGYIDYGETWQGAARRELHEETGILLPEGEIRLYDVQNGLDNTLVIFGLASAQPDAVVKPYCSAETAEVVIITKPETLGFTMHTGVVARYFEERTRNK